MTNSERFRKIGSNVYEIRPRPKRRKILTPFGQQVVYGAALIALLFGVMWVFNLTSCAAHPLVQSALNR